MGRTSPINLIGSWHIQHTNHIRLFALSVDIQGRRLIDNHHFATEIPWMKISAVFLACIVSLCMGGSNRSAYWYIDAHDTPVSYVGPTNHGFTGLLSRNRSKAMAFCQDEQLFNDDLKLRDLDRQQLAVYMAASMGTTMGRAVFPGDRVVTDGWMQDFIDIHDLPTSVNAGAGLLTIMLNLPEDDDRLENDLIPILEDEKAFVNTLNQCTSGTLAPFLRLLPSEMIERYALAIVRLMRRLMEQGVLIDVTDAYIPVEVGKILVANDDCVGQFNLNMLYDVGRVPEVAEAMNEHILESVSMDEDEILQPGCRAWPAKLFRHVNIELPFWMNNLDMIPLAGLNELLDEHPEYCGTLVDHADLETVIMMAPVMTSECVLHLLRHWSVKKDGDEQTSLDGKKVMWMMMDGGNDDILVDVAQSEPNLLRVIKSGWTVIDAAKKQAILDNITDAHCSHLPAEMFESHASSLNVRPACFDNMLEAQPAAFLNTVGLYRCESMSDGGGGCFERLKAHWTSNRSQWLSQYIRLEMEGDRGAMMKQTLDKLDRSAE